MDEVLRRDIFTDCLTGLPNLFEFIKSDTDKIFGDKGSIIIVDIMNFLAVNINYGEAMGDLCLRLMGKLIREIISEYSDVTAYRTDGDEFTIILPGCGIGKAKEACVEISTKYKRIMNENGFTDMDVHLLKLEYNEKINNIGDFYKIVFDYILIEARNSCEKFSSKDWGHHIISSFTNRIKETLGFFDGAYNLALTDDVSGLPNSRAAKIYLNSLLDIEDEENKNFSVLFIDGDNLKKYNNEGYSSGNEMIKKLSKVIKNSASENNRVYRWLSGDEFLVVLNRAGDKEVLEIAERIRKKVEEESKKWMYSITVSIGVATYPKDGNTINKLVEKAEKANSMAKDSGKNKVIKCD
ncbi:diguanylate cyclase domain-containing protein [Haloimpatiens sp. FM7315]|uniref:GGDEF domain-containing protein n=1 Tax=Haloimpatiens sp. FM7315 TaxID=3298609 RepID=UPI00370CD385